MEHIREHFRKNDPRVYKLSQKISLQKLVKSDDYFKSLTREIIGQQLSGKAADSIFQKVLMLFPQNKITPQAVLSLTDEILRSAGPSWAKVRFIKDLAEKIVGGKINLQKLDGLSDDEVIRNLTQVKGIGPWTGEMFLMFSLARENIFSHGDLGLAKAIRRLYGFKKQPTRKKIEKIIAKWSPYKTYACLLLWDFLDFKDKEVSALSLK